MMSGFFNKLIGVMRNSHGITYGIGPSCTRSRRNVANDDNDAVGEEPTPQGGEGDEFYCLKEFNRL